MTNRRTMLEPLFEAASQSVRQRLAARFLPGQTPPSEEPAEESLSPEDLSLLESHLAADGKK